MEKTKLKKGILILYGIIGFFFAFFVKSEWDLSHKGDIYWSAKYILFILAIGLLGAFAAIALYGLASFILEKKRKKESSIVKNISPRIAFLGSLGINILVYLPFFLAFYPGLCAYDVAIQLGQIFNSDFNDHHPLFHTLFMKGSLVLGKNIFNSYNAGMAICTLIQMLLLSLALAFVIYTLNQCGVSLFWQIFSEVLFALNLFNGYMAVSITKDTVFTAFLLLMLCSFSLILHERKRIFEVLLVISSIGVCLFRNNGKYAFLVFIIAIAVAFIVDKKNRKIWRNVGIEILCSLAVAIILGKLAFNLTEATPGDKREMLSVPIQQIGRVAYLEKEHLTKEELSFIDEFIIYEAYENYNPVISDPCKGFTNTSLLRYQPKRFAKMYFELFKRFPSDYINAALALIGGYVSPFDETYRMMALDDVTVTRNYIQHTWTVDGYEGIYEDSKWPAAKTFFDEWAENDGFNIPVLKIFFIPGIYLWIYAIIFVSIVDKKQFKRLPSVIFILAFFGTLLLGPTMNLRYIYPCMVALPIFLTGKTYEA